VRRLALLQNAPRFGEVAANLDAARAALEGVKADLVVLPELFATGYQFASGDEVTALAEPAPGGPTTAALEAIARATGATVVAGLAELAEDGAIYNSAAVVYPSGFLTTYRKLHLFHEERTWFAPGPRPPPVIRTPQGLRVGVMICFDWRFPEVARHLALEGADVIAHPSNLVRPHCPDAMVTRALENVVYCATANRVGEEARGGRPALRFIGRSQVVSPKGERIAALDGEEAGRIEVEVDLGLARDKSVTGCDDLFGARTRVLGIRAIRRPAVSECRYAVLRHEAADGAAHFDFFVEQDGRLVSWRLESALPERRDIAMAAERSFDHRLAYLDFEGDLGAGRGSVQAVERGVCRCLIAQAGLFLFQLGGRGKLVVKRLAGPERDLWRFTSANE
jgi:predicted amidohydrolase